MDLLMINKFGYDYLYIIHKRKRGVKKCYIRDIGINMPHLMNGDIAT